MNGKTGAFTQTWPEVRRGMLCSLSGWPMVILAAMRASGNPEALATKGTVRDDRGFTSST